MDDHSTPLATVEPETRKNMMRALEDNERVYFHPDSGLVAVWYGGATVSIYTPDTWEEVDMFTQSQAFRDESTVSDVENAVTCRLAEMGYVREGRGSGNTQPRTKVVERY